MANELNRAENWKRTIDEVVEDHVLDVLARTETLLEAAKILGMDPSTLWRFRDRRGMQKYSVRRKKK